MLCYRIMEEKRTLLEGCLHAGESQAVVVNTKAGLGRE